MGSKKGNQHVFSGCLLPSGSDGIEVEIAVGRVEGSSLRELRASFHDEAGLNSAMTELYTLCYEHNVRYRCY